MDQKEEAAVAFTWHDKYFDMPSPLTYEELNFELCCILHNVGAVHSYLGAVENRTSAEGMKISCTHFQCAAWAFQHLRDGFACEKYSTDFDRNLLTWCSALMLVMSGFLDVRLPVNPTSRSRRATPATSSTGAGGTAGSRSAPGPGVSAKKLECRPQADVADCQIAAQLPTVNGYVFDEIENIALIDGRLWKNLIYCDRKYCQFAVRRRPTDRSI